MFQPRYLFVILAKIVVPAVVPPTRIIRPIPAPTIAPPKIIFIIISFESIAQFLVKCKNNEFNSTAIIVYPIVFRLKNLYPMINNKPFKIKFIKPGDQPYK